MTKLYVVGFAFRHDKSGSLLLIRKNRPEWQAGKYNGIGGKIEHLNGETAHGAMVREFREETGVAIGLWRKVGSLYGANWKVHVFASNTWEVDGARTTTDEEVAMFHKDHLPPNIMHNLPWLIPMAYDCLHNQMFREYNIEEANAHTEE